MKFSIITATYNSAASILDTVRSLREQTIGRSNIEWILVDGGSTDNTLELIEAQDFHPDQWVSEPDNGIYDALNKGVRMATGEKIGFLHADDILATPGILHRVSCAFDNSGADAVYGDLQYVRPLENGELGVVRHWKSGIYHRRKLSWGWMPPHPSFFMNREIYEQVKLENGDYFNTDFTCAADYDFMTRVLGMHGIEPAYLMVVLVKMRIGGVSNRSLKHIITKSKEDWQVIRQNKLGGPHTLIGKNVGKLPQFIMR